MNQLDCRTWTCPKPVVEVRRAILATPTEWLKVLVADEVSRQNVRRMAESLGCVVREEAAEGGFALILSPAKGEQVRAAVAGGKTVVLIGSETMGEGSDDLGRVLLRNFLITLAEVDNPPEAIYLVNGGVKLPVAGADTVEILEKLACNGVDIASCGLCLDYYKLKDRLAVGRVTNMLDIAGAMLQAGRVIRP